MERFCRYHPLVASSWQCQRCACELCEQCLPQRHLRGSLNCPKCQGQVRYHGNTAHITPFWMQINELFAYPFALSPLLLIALCTLGPLLADEGLLGVLVFLILLAAQSKYLFAVLAKTAEGQRRPPDLRTAFESGGIRLLVQQAGIVIFLVVAFALMDIYLGSQIAFFVGLLIIIGIPAILILLALEGDLKEALAPSRWIPLMLSVGWPYLLMCGFLLLLYTGATAIQNFLLLHFSQQLAYPLTGMVGSYFLCIAFHLMGYLAWQHGDRLGPGMISPPQTTPEMENRSSKIEELQETADLDVALKEGRYALASTLLADRLKRRKRDPMALLDYYRLLWEIQDDANLVKHAQRFLPILVESQNTPDTDGNILDFCRYLLSADSAFRVDSPSLAIKISTLAYYRRHYRLALALLRPHLFDSAPGAETLLVAQLAARILGNGLKDKARAGQVLRKTLQLAGLADAYRQQLTLDIQQLQETGKVPESKANFQASD